MVLKPAGVEGSLTTQPLCFCAHPLQDMNSAVITPCSHFFHAGCLKKWLYVQETCPLCHSQLKSLSPTTNQDAPAANQTPAGPEEAPAGKKPDDANEEGAAEQGVVGGTASSSGVQSTPQKLAKIPSSSSNGELVNETLKQSLTEGAVLSSTSSSANEPDSAPQLNRGFLLDRKESPPGSSSQLDHPTSPPTEEQSPPPPCSL